MREYHGFDYLCFTGIGYLGLLASGKLLKWYMILSGKSYGNVIVDYNFIKRLDKVEDMVREIHSRVESCRCDMLSDRRMLGFVEEKVTENGLAFDGIMVRLRSLELSMDSILKDVI